MRIEPMMPRLGIRISVRQKGFTCHLDAGLCASSFRLSHSLVWRNRISNAVFFQPCGRPFPPIRRTRKPRCSSSESDQRVARPQSPSRASVHVVAVEMPRATVVSIGCVQPRFRLSGKQRGQFDNADIDSVRHRRLAADWRRLFVV